MKILVVKSVNVNGEWLDKRYSFDSFDKLREFLEMNSRKYFKICFVNDSQFTI